MEKKAISFFSKLRAFFWPIYQHELKKFVPMILMILCICFNSTLLRTLKDSIIIPETSAGAAILPFLKMWGVLPAAVISTIIFTYLSNHFSRKALFHLIIISFLTFFLAFALFIYPNREALQPNTLADMLQEKLPQGFSAIISMVRHWPLSLFYIAAEIWTCIVLNVLFWGFANEITKISEAKRFYTILTFGSSIATFIAGQTGAFVNRGSTMSWESNLTHQILLVTLSGAVALLAFNWIIHYSLGSEEIALENAAPKKEEKHLSFKESLIYIAHSKHLLSIAILVLSYNLVISLVEIVWKEQLRQLCPQPQEYNTYLNKLTSVMGIISSCSALLFVGLFHKIGWTKTALITPLVLFVTSALFFLCLIGNSVLSPILAAVIGLSPLAIAVFIGAVQNCFSRAAKYSIFDATKEMAFIPLDPEHKLKGKAAIDGFGSRLGKSGAALILQGFYFIFCSVTASVPYIAVILITVISIWMIAVISLGRTLDTPKEEPATATAN